MNIFTDEKIAQEYDAYYTSDQGKVIDDLEKQAIIELMKPINPGKMLEIGCGTGHWTELFSEMGFQITATDVSPAMMSQAKKKLIPNVIFLEADVCQLPFQDNYFDQVATITALEFCGNIQQAFSEIKRVLKPDGWLIIGSLNADSILGKTKDSDSVFKHAELMTKPEFERHLQTIGKPTIIESVFLSPEFEILDHSDKKHTAAGAFIAAAVQKTNVCTSPSK